MSDAAETSKAGPGRPKAGTLLLRQDAVDLSAGLVLTLLGLVGFRTAFAGSDYLVAGIGAALLGTVAAWGAVRLRLPWWAKALGVVALFAIFSAPIAFRAEAIAGVLPSASSIHALGDGLVNGWARLLTAVPPSGDTGHVLAVPFFCGFVGTAGAGTLALVVRRWPLCVLPPLAVLAVTILFGTVHPAARVLQGAVFATVALAWVSLRADRLLNIVTGRTRRFRVVGAFALLVASALGALALAPKLPLASAHERYVLRDRIQPPFDPRQDPSPLVAFRKYITGDGANQDLFTVTGLLPGRSIRLATLDGYDGAVWTTTGSGSDTAGRFESVGSQVPGAPPGDPEDVTLSIDDLRGVWLPTAGAARSVRFVGSTSQTLAQTWRFDSTTGTAAVPDGITNGDRYTITGTVPTSPPAAALRRLSLAAVAAVSAPNDVPQAIPAKASSIVSGATNPYDQAKKLEAFFQKGFYSDGGQKSGVAPGHSLARLEDFLASQQPVGDAEQYAAGMALLARTLGMPVRVVMGFRPQVASADKLVVRGKDVDAWVEIDFDHAGWIPFYPTPPKDHVASQTVPQPVQAQNNQNPPPPPTTVPASSPPPAASQAKTSKPQIPPKPHRLIASGSITPIVAGAAGALLVVLALPGLLVWALKARRRRHRRSRGDPARRAAGAWAEAVDLVRDSGHPLPERATRQELARTISEPEFIELAAVTDTVVFGPDPPNDAQAVALWQRSHAARKSLLGRLGFFARLRAGLSVTSLRPVRAGSRKA
jgi:TgpA N-terminal domain/Transglutaminase-like superfamily